MFLVGLIELSKINNQFTNCYLSLDDIMLAGFITGCKNSLQGAKQKIDMYLTNRSIFPEFFGNRDPLLPELQQSAQTW